MGGEEYTDNKTDLLRPAFKMLNPIGGQGVCCTIAEKENNISNPWLWIAQKHASKAISKKSQEFSGLRRPGEIKICVSLFLSGRSILTFIWQIISETTMIWKLSLTTSTKINVRALSEGGYLTVRGLPYLKSHFSPKYWRSILSEEGITVWSELHIEESKTVEPFGWCCGSKDISKRIPLKHSPGIK